MYATAAPSRCGRPGRRADPEAHKEKLAAADWLDRHGYRRAARTPHGIPGSTDGRDAELARGRHTVGCAGPTGPPVLPAFTISGGRRAAERNHDCRHAVACADTDQHRDQRRRSATTPRSTGDPGSGRSAHAPRRAGRSPRCPRDADGVPVNETRMGGSGP